MTIPRLLNLTAAMAILASLTAPAAAQQRPTSGARVTYPSANSSGMANMPPACRSHCFSWERGHHGFRSAFPGVLIVERPLDYARDEREPVVVKEVVQDAPPPPAAVPLPQGGGAKERKPYVIGASYASLPGGCMKLIEEGTSFYYCGGDWYREVRGGRDPLYRAVARRL